jgi:hypothetical protein
MPLDNCFVMELMVIDFKVVAAWQHCAKADAEGRRLLVAAIAHELTLLEEHISSGNGPKQGAVAPFSILRVRWPSPIFSNVRSSGGGGGGWRGTAVATHVLREVLSADQRNTTKKNEVFGTHSRLPPSQWPQAMPPQIQRMWP